MDNPELSAAKVLACLAVVESEGRHGRDAADRLKQLMRGETAPDEPVEDEIERIARNSRLQHEAYVAWLRGND